jgi:hypothetical protein
MWKLKYACSCIEGYKTWSVKLVGEIKSEVIMCMKSKPLLKI